MVKYHQITKQDIQRIYRQFSRRRYLKFKHQFPRMRSAQIISKLMDEWNSFNSDDILNLYNIWKEHEGFDVLQEQNQPFEDQQYFNKRKHQMTQQVLMNPNFILKRAYHRTKDQTKRAEDIQKKNSELLMTQAKQTIKQMVDKQQYESLNKLPADFMRIQMARIIRQNTPIGKRRYSFFRNLYRKADRAAKRVEGLVKIPNPQAHEWIQDHQRRYRTSWNQSQRAWTVQKSRRDDLIKKYNYLKRLKKSRSTCAFCEVPVTASINRHYYSMHSQKLLEYCREQAKKQGKYIDQEEQQEHPIQQKEQSQQSVIIVWDQQIQLEKIRPQTYFRTQQQQQYDRKQIEKIQAQIKNGQSRQDWLQDISKHKLKMAKLYQTMLDRYQQRVNKLGIVVPPQIYYKKMENGKLQAVQEHFPDSIIMSQLQQQLSLDERCIVAKTQYHKAFMNPDKTYRYYPIPYNQQEARKQIKYQMMNQRDQLRDQIQKTQAQLRSLKLRFQYDRNAELQYKSVMSYKENLVHQQQMLVKGLKTPKSKKQGKQQIVDEQQQSPEQQIQSHLSQDQQGNQMFVHRRSTLIKMQEQRIKKAKQQQ